MAGQNSLTLSFTDVETITSYYRAVITKMINSPTPVPNQQKISLTRTVNLLNIGGVYYIYIGTGTYSLTTTAATSGTDNIGEGLALDITNNAPGITATYEPDVNIISLLPLQSDISVSVSSTAASHDMRILSGITGEGCKLVTDSVKITVNLASTLVQTGGQSGTTDNLCTGDVIGVGGDKIQSSLSLEVGNFDVVKTLIQLILQLLELELQLRQYLGEIIESQGLMRLL